MSNNSKRESSEKNRVPLKSSWQTQNYALKLFLFLFPSEVCFIYFDSLDFLNKCNKVLIQTIDSVRCQFIYNAFLSLGGENGSCTSGDCSLHVVNSFDRMSEAQSLSPLVLHMSSSWLTQNKQRYPSNPLQKDVQFFDFRPFR